jgi:hypothetical protein
MRTEKCGIRKRPGMNKKYKFATEHKLYLPTEQELIEEIEREKVLIVREKGEKYTVSSTQ